MKTPNPSARFYYWECCKRFGHECYHSWRTELATGVVVAIVIYLLTRSDKTALEKLGIAIEATIIVFSGFVIFHLFRTPFLVHREQPLVHSKFGVFGIALLLLLVAAVSYRIAKPWLFQLPNIAINAPPPPVQMPPLAVLTEPKTLRGKASPQTVTPQPAVTQLGVTQTPVTQPPAQINQGVAPQTWLERVTQINKNLTKGDRERLADALFDFSKVLDQANTLMYSADAEGGQLRNAWQSGSIVKELDAHAKKLREIDSSAKNFFKLLSQFSDRWKYYPCSAPF